MEINVVLFSTVPELDKENNYWEAHFFVCTLWLFNIAMENGPFIDDVPINTSIYKGFSMAMLNNQMVNVM
jgi:hypothetical protein